MGRTSLLIFQFKFKLVPKLQTHASPFQKFQSRVFYHQLQTLMHYPLDA